MQQTIKNGSSLEYFGVQSLRGFAACLVVAHHASYFYIDHALNASSGLIFNNGAVGVDIFFVISGFVMAISTIGKGEGLVAGWSFLKRRVLRVTPMYWLITSIALLKMLLSHIPTSLRFILASYFFIPYHNNSGSSLSLLPVGWTLSFEMLFYLLFTAALILKTGVLRLLTPTLIALAIVGFYRKDNWPLITLLANPLLVEFLAGLWLGVAVKSGRRMYRWLAVVLGTLGLIGLLGLSFPVRSLLWGIPAFLIVLAVVMLEIPWGSKLPKWSLLIGDASYSLYLSHLLSFSIALRVLDRLHLLSLQATWQNEVVTILICLLIAVAVSIPLYLFIEKPLTGSLLQRPHSSH